MRLENKVAVVTGAARGIGKAIALGMASEGARVFICDIDLAEAEKTASQIAKQGYFAEPEKMDIRCRYDIERVIEVALERFGSIDIMVNNAGIASVCSIFNTSDEEMDRVLDINLKGTLYCCQAAGNFMAKQQSGSIINISSISGQHGGGQLGTTIYAASKGGILSATKGYAKELAPFHVRVNSIAPSSIDTAISERFLSPEKRLLAIQKIPLGRRGTPQDIVGAAIYLASDESGFVTGACINVNGGLLMI